jgi:predicted metal-dependent phosphoesterase TrpH
MKIDLHIHSKSCSDGKLPLPQIIQLAHRRQLQLISITDHDSIECQESAEALSSQMGLKYVTGVELNITFAHAHYKNGKSIALDVLGYDFDFFNVPLIQKIKELKAYRRIRAEKILERINVELKKNGFELFTHKDLEAIEETVDGAFGRPHIANYMVEKAIVASRQEAFDKYLVKCNVPKMPVTLQEAAELIRGAGGKLVLAHPNDPNGTSLATLSRSLREQHRIIRDAMMPYLDGIECWHSRHDKRTVSAYVEFAKREGLLMTGGSDCHQQPVVMGNVRVPSYVADQFLRAP